MFCDFIASCELQMTSNSCERHQLRRFATKTGTLLRVSFPRTLRQRETNNKCLVREAIVGDPRAVVSSQRRSLIGKTPKTRLLSTLPQFLSIPAAYVQRLRDRARNWSNCEWRTVELLLNTDFKWVCFFSHTKLSAARNILFLFARLLQCESLTDTSSRPERAQRAALGRITFGIRRTARAGRSGEAKTLEK